MLISFALLTQIVWNKLGEIQKNIYYQKEAFFTDLNGVKYFILLFKNNAV